MLRFLLCISCCSAPPNNRAAKARKISSATATTGTSGQKSSEEEAGRLQGDQSKQPEALLKGNAQEVDSASLLLANQIQANNADYGTAATPTAMAGSNEEGEAAGNSQGKIKLPAGRVASIESREPATLRGQLDETASKAAKSVAVELHQFTTSGAYSNEEALTATTESKRASDLSAFENYDVDSSSSIDVDQFVESREVLPARQDGVGDDAATIDTLVPAASTTAADGTTTNAAETARLQPTPSLQQARPPQATAATTTEPPTSGGEMAGPARNIASTTKIGDYARIEYSPIEDLDSVTTQSFSRAGSERGAARSQASSSLSRRHSERGTAAANARSSKSESASRRSSQGIESTSISIASQLSNEQLQQNLTNMLETANSPTTMFGTIGLPLGPPLAVTPTDKRSPETPGAALTSASQDSLSDASLGEIGVRTTTVTSNQVSRQATIRSNNSTSAALVNDSIEDSTELPPVPPATPAPLATGEDEPYSNNKRAVSAVTAAESRALDRMGSPQSIATTTSGGLTNPTPTPSELSGSSSVRKKKFRAKALLKKFKPGSKKKKKDIEVGGENAD